jgi:hypothetical protein
MTYVVAPEGYVGKTTCYEIGRVLQAGKPLYFSNAPQDLPILVPSRFVIEADVLVQRILTPAWQPVCLYDEGDSLCEQLERELRDGRYRQN